MKFKKEKLMQRAEAEGVIGYIDETLEALFTDLDNQEAVPIRGIDESELMCRTKSGFSYLVKAVDCA